ncbi:hypothetical protein FXO37_35448 [Capsicum annuum]|nr:hypothetical protein FXO37_35448 [Capsicum annuum]
MFLLDGCFVVEYIREFCDTVGPKEEDKIINTDWMEGLVDGNLLLLENQLSFFVLTKLHDMTKQELDESRIDISNIGSIDRLLDSENKDSIRPRIGDDREVTRIFNKLREGVVPSPEFYYKNTCKEVVEYCEKTWNKRMANLWHTYFNGSWVVLSTAATVLLFVLTLTQTILAFINECDKRVYIKNTPNHKVIVCLYVDDMLSINRDISDINATKRILESKFNMKDLGVADVILEIRIHKIPQGLALSKSHYIEKKHNTVRELLSNGIITVNYVKSNDNVLNPLIKGLSREGVERISKEMGLRPKTSQHGGNSTGRLEIPRVRFKEIK